MLMSMLHRCVWKRLFKTIHRLATFRAMSHCPCGFDSSTYKSINRFTSNIASSKVTTINRFTYNVASGRSDYKSINRSTSNIASGKVTINRSIVLDEVQAPVKCVEIDASFYTLHRFQQGIDRWIVLHEALARYIPINVSFYIGRQLWLGNFKSFDRFWWHDDTSGKNFRGDTSLHKSETSTSAR